MRHTPAIAIAVVVLAVTSGCDRIDLQTATQPVTNGAGAQPSAPERTEAPPPEAAPATPGRVDAPVSRDDAMATARQSASEYLTMADMGFGVAPEDWQVTCSRGESGAGWSCVVSQGPCSGTLDIRRVTIGGQLRGIGEVGCVAD